MLYEVETCSRLLSSVEFFSILTTRFENSLWHLILCLDFLGNEGTPDSVNPSVVDEEEGLPSPPLDEGALFATQPTSMELLQVCFLFF